MDNNVNTFIKTHTEASMATLILTTLPLWFNGALLSDSYVQNVYMLKEDTVSSINKRVGRNTLGEPHQLSIEMHRLLDLNKTSSWTLKNRDWYHFYANINVQNIIIKTWKTWKILKFRAYFSVIFFLIFHTACVHCHKHSKCDNLLNF